MGGVEPFGQVTPRNEVDAPMPGGKTFDGAQQMAQRTPIPIADFGGIHSLVEAAVAPLSLPGGVRAIAPQNYKIDCLHLLLYQ